MLVLEVDNKFSNGDAFSFTDEISIGELTGTRFEGSHFVNPARQRRKCCRYVRSDLRASIALGRFAFRQKSVSVRLVDVSQVGVSIGFAEKLKPGQHLRLRLIFQDGRDFVFDCAVVNRRSGDNDMVYGIKFDKSNGHFEEHLLKTGLKIKLHNASMVE